MKKGGSKRSWLHWARLIYLGDYKKAKETFPQPIQIADEISFVDGQHETRGGLAETYLLQNDVVNMRG